MDTPEPAEESCRAVHGRRARAHGLFSPIGGVGVPLLSWPLGLRLTTTCQHDHSWPGTWTGALIHVTTPRCRLHKKYRFAASFMAVDPPLLVGGQIGGQMGGQNGGQIEYPARGIRVRSLVCGHIGMSLREGICPRVNPRTRQVVGLDYIQYADPAAQQRQTEHGAGAQLRSRVFPTVAEAGA